jgi:DNA polymerase-3 subunit gamma/tau
MLSGAAVHHVDGHRVVLAHPSAPLAERLSDPRFSAPIVAAFQAVFGVDMEVGCVHVPRSEGTPIEHGAGDAE